jgi:hypothetical protein
MLFGGRSHAQYLGCLNCSKYDSESVFNRYGEFGNKYSDTSIFNRYGDFGSRYSEYSACSPYADDPPVIVDQGSNFYGRLTVNRSHPQATRDANLLAWVHAVCER